MKLSDVPSITRDRYAVFRLSDRFWLGQTRTYQDLSVGQARTANRQG